MKSRLSLLYFLQFSVWGCYLTCFGQLLGAGGIGRYIAWFYAAIGLVSIITPPLLGRLADKTDHPERILAGCHFTAAIVMTGMWWYAFNNPALEFNIFYTLYLLFLALYMPTMALANTTSFRLLTCRGKSPVTDFPSIRVWGTVGFVGAMWFVNSAYWIDGHLGFAFTDSSDIGHLRFQYNSMQLLCSGIFGYITAFYALTLPGSDKHDISNINQSKSSIFQSLRQLLGIKEVSVFLIFVCLTGVCLQISNGYVTPFITHFSALSEYASSLAADNATMLFSLSQISEACCILLVGIALKRRGMIWVYAIGLLAWTIRFFMLGIGNPGDGLWLLVGSMIAYGVAFNFITIAGHIYIQQIAPEGMKGFAQGLMMFMSNGVGATLGTLGAGAIVNHWCTWQSVTVPGGASMRLFMGEWQWPWLIFAGYALLLTFFWLLATRYSDCGTEKLMNKPG